MKRAFPCVLLLAAFLCGTSCCTRAPLAAVDLSEPGWGLQQGQAVWRRDAQSTEIAGEFVLATNVTGRAWVQFTKTPLPVLTAQSGPDAWEVEINMTRRRFCGRGAPSTQLIWLHLAPSLAGRPPPKPLRFERAGPGEWRLENTVTGEQVSGFVAP